MRKLVLNMRDRRPVWAMPEWVVDAIREALPADWELVAPTIYTDGTGDGTSAVAPELLAAVHGAEVYMGFGLPRPLFDAATTGPAARLRWIHSGSAGVRSALFPAMVESDVILTNSAGIHGPAIAESVIGMVLYFCRGFDFAAEGKRDVAWRPERFWGEGSPVREAAGATLGILGFGGIGQEVAKRALALGMRVLAAKRRPSEAPDGVEVLTGDDGIDHLLEQSDFVAITVPDTPETRGLVSAERIRAMKPGATLINISRGSVVDEPALVEALQAGRLRGAGLDVFATEPLPADSPLWRLPNVLITPHVSPVTRGFWRRETALIVENIRRYLAGEPLVNVVDKASGY